jgi:hypothetical protein
MTNMKNKLIALSLLLAAQIPAANAAIIVVAPTGSSTGSFQITDDITFTITANGSLQYFVFDEWVAMDAGQTTQSLSPFLSFTINGSPFTEGSQLMDNIGFNLGETTPNDGLLIINSPFSVLTGDTVTLQAGTYSIGSAVGFNPLATQTFTGDIFLTNGSGVRLSDNATAAIPEPSSAALILGVMSVFALARRRNRKT